MYIMTILKSRILGTTERLPGKQREEFVGKKDSSLAVSSEGMIWYVETSTK